MAALTPFQKEDAALSLTLAVVGSSPSPLLLLDGALNVITASSSFCRAFQIDRASVPGRQLFALGAGEWDVPQLRSLLRMTLADDAEIKASEINLERDGQAPRRLVVHAERLVYLDLKEIRLLLAVADVTDARAAEKQAEDLRIENALLLKEVRHRIANSLQIIATVLLQDARKSVSEETRSHLRNAHNRLMSVAALERHLSASEGGEVQLRPYLTHLCESIGASLISEPGLVSLEVIAEDATVGANVSVSLGLIVTELVINALKHAFPGHRSGKITVGYAARGKGWELTVGDNGVGMPGEAANAVAGLGTSIVRAVAKQLSAHVVVNGMSPGTSVSIIQLTPLSGRRAAGAASAPV